uniref:Uncharacterized protein n=1 Tax=Arundo donax TaxID=35708 RepID=A0A0A9GPM1_ARUDO
MAAAFVGTNQYTLPVGCIASSSDHLMQIIPINNFTVLNAPNANLFIQRTTDEVSIVNRVELNACHVVTM